MVYGTETSRGVITRFFARTDQYGSWWDAYAPKIRGSHPGTRPYYARRGSKKSLQMSVNPYISTSALRVEDRTRTRIWRALPTARDPY